MLEKRSFDTSASKQGRTREQHQFALKWGIGGLGIDLVLLHGLLSLQADALVVSAAIVITISMASFVWSITILRDDILYGFYFVKGETYRVGNTLHFIGGGCTVMSIGMVVWHISWIVGVVFIILALAVSVGFINIAPRHDEYLESCERTESVSGEFMKNRESSVMQERGDSENVG